MIIKNLLGISLPISASRIHNYNSLYLNLKYNKLITIAA